MFKTVEFPGSVPHLDSSLSNVDANHLPLFFFYIIISFKDFPRFRLGVMNTYKMGSFWGMRGTYLVFVTLLRQEKNYFISRYNLVNTHHSHVGKKMDKSSKVEKN